jgi:hypothetical protein
MPKAEVKCQIARNLNNISPLLFRFDPDNEGRISAEELR